jgi:ABC-type bacteriocin/lantibiotic exporter with double-glycine peptidase domain
MEVTECGAACLAMVLDYHRGGVPLSAARQACGTSRDGVSAARIYKAAVGFGLSAKAFRAEPANLGALSLPAILHWEFNHFVVLERVGRRSMTIVDPAIGRRKLGAKAFSSAFTGVVISFQPGAGWCERPRRSASLARYRQLLASLRSGWLSVVCAALLLELLGLGFPAANQVLIDHVLLPRREGWIWPLTLLLGLCTLTFLVTTGIRDRVIRRLHFALDLDLMSGFVKHMLSLPLSFFQQRTTGDLLQRVAAQSDLREASLKALTGALDALLILGYGAMMLAYDLRIGAAIVGMELIRVASMLLMHPAIANATTTELAEHGKELSAAVEPLAVPELIRAFGAEDLAVDRYQARLVSRLNAEVHRDSLSQSTRELGGVLGGLAQAAVVFMGGQAVLADQMTLGVFAGLVTLQGLLHKPMASLVEAISVATRVRGVLSRIDDVLEAKARPAGERMVECVRGEITLEDVCFRYDSQGPLLCDQIELRISAGEKVAIVGRLGQGKTTLLRLIVGLLAPTRGRVLLDGVPLSEIAPSALARQIGVVLQEPFMLDESVRANLSLSWPDAPEESLRRAARIACIEHVIDALPDGFDTVLGDNAARLSGGERQRLALARALVSSPRVLVLDEATASLDLEAEARVHENLSSVGCTRVLVAHRMATVRDADRILVVDGGRIVEQGSFDSLRARGGPFAQLLSGYEGITL